MGALPLSPPFSLLSAAQPRTAHIWVSCDCKHDPRGHGSTGLVHRAGQARQQRTRSTRALLVTVLILLVARSALHAAPKHVCAVLRLVQQRGAITKVRRCALGRQFCSEEVGGQRELAATAGMGQYASRQFDTSLRL